MYPDLSYLLHDLFGTEPDNWTSIFKTFGIMLVSAILIAARLLYVELRRMSNEGVFKGTKVRTVEGLPPKTSDLIGSGIFGFLLGFKGVHAYQNFTAFKADPAAVVFSTQGNILAGLLFAAAFAGFRYYEKKKEQLPKPKETVERVFPHDRIGDITMIAALTGIIGARLFSLIEDLPAFFADPIGVLFSGSGLAIYGGLIGGFLGVVWYLRRHKIPVLPVADAIAPALIIAYGVGRIGCQLSGDGDWGVVAAAQPEWWFLPDWLWAYDYPNNVAQSGIPIEGCEAQYCRQLAEARYPTPVYETLAAFAIGGILWVMRKAVKPAGTLFCIYLIFNGIERFVIEKIRVNEDYNVLGTSLTQAEMIAVCLFLIGVIGVFVLRRKGAKA